MRKEMRCRIPKVWNDTIHYRRNPATGEEFRTRSFCLSSLSKKMHESSNPDNRYELIRTYIDLRDLVDHMKAWHISSNFTVTYKVEASADGVEESKTSGYTNVFVCISFIPCRKPMLWQVFASTVEFEFH